MGTSEGRDKGTVDSKQESPERTSGEELFEVPADLGVSNESILGGRSGEPGLDTEGRVDGASEDERSECVADSGLPDTLDLEVFRLGYPGWQSLRHVNIDIEEITDHVTLLARSMVKTMYGEPGVGLAAPQVGANVNLIVVDPQYNPEDESTRKPVIMINPKITETGDETSVEQEACLSVPNLLVEIERPTEVVVEFRDIGDNQQRFALEGFAARVVQHELDHLNGKLIVDYLSPLRRKMYLRGIFKVMRKAKKVQKRIKKRANIIRASERRLERVRSRNVQPVSTEEPKEERTLRNPDGVGNGDSNS